MANEEQIAHLKEGVAAWNAWRAAHLEVGPDLSGAPLRGLDLTGADFERANLKGADLRGKNMGEANLTGANLEGANFFKAILNGANLANANLRGAQFLNCAQLESARDWPSATRDEDLACGQPIPD